MGIWQKIKSALAGFMAGRNGVDNLGYASLWTGLILSLADSFIGTGLLGLAGTALYVYALFRMLSRNCYKRAAENNAYVRWRYQFTTQMKQFWMRLKNSREYKYVNCRQCRVLIRMKRGGGMRTLRCPKCGCEFTAKS
ncbi:MAG: hypothetical protein IJ507_09860 [Clostridia bacterium]|nr:hypothetical protein [Clostridia bacterium]